MKYVEFSACVYFILVFLTIAAALFWCIKPRPLALNLVIPTRDELLVPVSEKRKAIRLERQKRLIKKIAAALKAGKTGECDALYRSNWSDIDPLLEQALKKAFADKGWEIEFVECNVGFKIRLAGQTRIE